MLIPPTYLIYTTKKSLYKICLKSLIQRTNIFQMQSAGHALHLNLLRDTRNLMGEQSKGKIKIYRDSWLSFVSIKHFSWTNTVQCL